MRVPARLSTGNPERGVHAPSPVVRRVAAAAGLAIALAAARDDPLAGRIAGVPAHCIDLDRVSGPAIEDDGTIFYRENGRRTWRASIIGTCARRQPFDTLIVEVYGSRLCANDRFRVREPGVSIPSGYCRFGPFTPFDKPAAVRR